jgi:hypothetical protein
MLLGGLAFAACGGRSADDDAAGTAGFRFIEGTGGSTGGTATGGAGIGGSTGSGAAPAVGGTGAGGKGPTGGAGTAAANSGVGGGVTRGCYYGGTDHTLGSIYPAGDGCNSCTCTVKGSNCGSAVCINPTCSNIEKKYEQAVLIARSCMPNQTTNACVYVVPAKLRCDCYTYVTDQTGLSSIEDEWQAAGCNDSTSGSCPLCPELGTVSFCGSDGTCASSFVMSSGGGAGLGGEAGAAGALQALGGAAGSIRPFGGAAGSLHPLGGAAGSGMGGSGNGVAGGPPPAK